MNCIAWAPWEYGLILAAGSSDGKVHILQRKSDDKWEHSFFDAHDGGVNAVSWGPATEPSMLSNEHISSQIDQQQFTLPPKRFVTGACDGKVKIWSFKENKFELLKDIGVHDDWVRDVAWSNNIGLLHDTIASCSEDNKVKIWKLENAQS